jgi:DNA-binding transcriptional ArsR family regulator
MWKKALTVVALAATVMALYLQIFERRARQEEARLAALHLEDALAGSRARLRAEILAELRAEIRKDGDAAQPGTEPSPDTVLRRLETSGALDAFRPQEALVIASLDNTLKSLARQTEESDRALRRDLEELRAAALRESDVSSKITSLMLVALVSLVGRLLPSLWPRAEDQVSVARRQPPEP